MVYPFEGGTGLEGFDIFLYICLGIAIGSIAVGILMVRRQCDHLIGKMFAGLFLLSVAIILISLFFGGWEGMGYGFIGISIFFGSMIGLAVTVLLRPIKKV